VGLIIHIDGGARGNPGPAGAGVVIRTDSGSLIHEAGYYLGHQTNNAAEYYALIRALERASRCAAQPLAVFSDSELLVRQITGAYEVKSPRLAELYRQVQLLLLRIGGWSLRHVAREENQRADELANLAIDQKRDVIVFDIEGLPDPQPAAAAPEQPGSSVDKGAGAGSGPCVSGESSVQVAASERGGLSADAELPTSHAPALPALAGQPAVRVLVERPPDPAVCPAGAWLGKELTVTTTLPAGMCLHAAHAILPTLLAMLGTQAEEFASIPTLTVRCSRPGCPAAFLLSPVPASNGRKPPAA
jgi:ribonuclease HI